jgi:hypothetical protein
MNQSGFLQLNWNDFLKGLIVAVVSAPLTVIAQTLSTGSFVFDWKAVAGTAGAALGAYLLKNLFSSPTGSNPTK